MDSKRIRIIAILFFVYLLTFAVHLNIYKDDDAECDVIDDNCEEVSILCDVNDDDVDCLQADEEANEQKIKEKVINKFKKLKRFKKRNNDDEQTRDEINRDFYWVAIVGIALTIVCSAIYYRYLIHKCKTKFRQII
ncbi:hypothetical protein ACKWTF_016096 [Chironomus riparius]